MKEIVILDSPKTVHYGAWVSSHLDCDTIIEDGDLSSDTINVVGYTLSEKYNTELRKLRKEKYPNCLLMRGIGHEEVCLCL